MLMQQWVVISLIVLVFITGNRLSAQCDTSQTPHFTVRLQGGNSADTLERSKILPGYQFEMRYDSCWVGYEISELNRNGQQIRWRHWCNGQRIKDLDAGPLSDTTTSVTFTASSGDTISCYRALNWVNPVLNESTPDNFSSIDSLDYAVELASPSTGSRLALLDSIGVIARAVRGTPELHGSRPIMALVRYAVPPALYNQSVQLRVRVYARGGGPHYFIRSASFGLDLSGRLDDPQWVEYLENFGGGLCKRTAPNQNGTALRSSALVVTPNPTTSGDVEIRYGRAAGDEAVSVVIFDIAGRQIFTPVSLRNASTSGVARFSFEGPGNYIVALYHNTTMVASEIITVTK